MSEWRGGRVSGGKRGELWGRSKGNSYKGRGRSKCEGHFVKGCVSATLPLCKALFLPTSGKAGKQAFTCSKLLSVLTLIPSQLAHTVSSTC